MQSKININSYALKRKHKFYYRKTGGFMIILYTPIQGLMFYSNTL